MRLPAAAAMLLLYGVAQAQGIGDEFVDTKDGGKLHVASRFVCPPKIGLFDRDAVGIRDVETGTDFCSYSALDGTYGTVTLTMLKDPYNPKAALAADFIQQEGIGARKLGETYMKSSNVTLYMRVYETSKLESMHYRIQYSGAAVGNWAVETTLEYASPRDTQLQKDFLSAIYSDAVKQIVNHAPPPAAPVPATPTPP
jgi:hypothetical protein